MHVTASDFQSKIGYYQDKALSEPIFVTRNGRPRTVLISTDEYHHLTKRNRQSLSVADLSEEDIAAIEATEYTEDDDCPALLLDDA